jgi:tartrate dehydrogenase/decarboxylase/D-malate dehydrogenase
MKTYRIALIPGDRIGQEVAPQGLRVLDAAAARAGSFRLVTESFPWGCAYYLQHGRMIAEDAQALGSLFFNLDKRQPGGPGVFFIRTPIGRLKAP